MAPLPRTQLRMLTAQVYDNARSREPSNAYIGTLPKIAELPSRFEGDADDSPNDSAALSLSAPVVPSVTRTRLRMRVVAPPLLDLEASSESVRVGLVYRIPFLIMTASFGRISTG